MKIIDKDYEYTYIINKSKFLSFAYPVCQMEKVAEILDDLRRKFHDATHICYGCVLSSPRLEKCSDDGEPSGTAGKPILELIKKRGLENILVVVVRYFGGIKLGAGGLIRAYNTSAKEVIDISNIIDASLGYKCEIVTSLSTAHNIQNILNKMNADIVNIEYANKVKITFVIDDLSKLNNIEYVVCGREIYENNQN